MALVLGLTMFGAACSSESLPIEIAEAFDAPGTTLVDRSEASIEDISRLDLAIAADRARAMGVDIRFLVLGPDDEFVSAKSLTDRYGGLAMTFKAGSEGFEGAGRNVSGDQLGRAMAAAGTKSTIGEAGLAFVDTFEQEGIATGAEGLGLSGNGGMSAARLLVLGLLAAATLFALFQLRAFLKSRKRAERRRNQFESRRQVLTDWANRLAPEVNLLTQAQGRLGTDGLQRLRESREFVASTPIGLEQAESLSDLDVTEIRIARTAMKLRDLRREVGI